QNILTLCTINGTKRDGMYGFRHADLVVLLPHNLDSKLIQEIENNLLAGYFRGCFSFSNAINQYLLARSLSQDPLVALRKLEDLSISKDYLRTEKDLITYMQESMDYSISILDQIPYIKRVQQIKDASGGFFVSYQLNEQFVAANISPMDVHKLGLKNNVGIIAAGSYIRINGLIKKELIFQFRDNLQNTLESLLKS
ncbi:hypothetical protein MJH12_13775, partial [bacterium]|nr:hypothetical protein [bacterium]